MSSPLDGDAVFSAVSVTTSPIEVKVGASRLPERQVITVQPLDGDIYFGYSASVTASSGTKIYQGQVYPFEATDKLAVYIVAASGSVDTRITEVS